MFLVGSVVYIDRKSAVWQCIFDESDTNKDYSQDSAEYICKLLYFRTTCMLS